MIAAIVLAGAAVTLLTWMVLDAAVGRTAFQRRLTILTRFAVRRPERKGRLLAAIRAAASRAGEWLTRLTRLDNHDLLDAAAVPIRPAEWLVIRVGAALGLALLLSVPLPWWLGLPTGLPAGFLVPNALLTGRIERRKRMFAQELPDTLQLVVSSLRAGFTLQHGIEASVRDSTGPVAAELRRALSETRLGGELEEALVRVGTRTGNADMKWLTMAIKLQREVGGNLSEVLQTTADTMRERERLRRSVQALSAEGRLSATILVAMPLLIGAWMFLFRRDYVRPLVAEPLGLAMLAGAGLLMIVGILWLRRVIRVEV
ncbi:type II secretion system F family protein [Actinoplanes sp. NPDC051470]|uniref:type II secretion system F family protein n=1 Tax=unclassified Actinoplanes TaxID=2626549 RepID=UPI003415AA73